MLSTDTWRPVALWSRPVEGWRRWQREQAGDLMRPDFSFGFLVMHLSLDISFLEIFNGWTFLNCIYVVWSADVGPQGEGQLWCFMMMWKEIRNKKIRNSHQLRIFLMSTFMTDVQSCTAGLNEYDGRWCAHKWWFIFSNNLHKPFTSRGGPNSQWMI